MRKTNFPKIVLGLIIFTILIFSLQIYRNFQEGHGCRDCIIERTLAGKEYDGWIKLSDTCEEYKFDKDSSLKCFNSTLPWKNELVKITQSKIKIPAIIIFNTIISSKYLPAFIIQGEDCKPSFAITPDGEIYSKGGCLG